MSGIQLNRVAVGLKRSIINITDLRSLSRTYNAPMLGQFVLFIEGPILISEEDYSTLETVSLLVDT